MKQIKILYSTAVNPTQMANPDLGASNNVQADANAFLAGLPTAQLLSAHLECVENGGNYKLSIVYDTTPSYPVAISELDTTRYQCGIFVDSSIDTCVSAANIFASDKAVAQMLFITAETDGSNVIAVLYSTELPL